MASDRKMTHEGVALLMELEGCKGDVYLDAGGKETIGVGHLVTDEERESGLIHGHSYGEGLTYEQCLAILAEDVQWAENAVSAFVQVDLSPYQFDALVSFCFNVGRRAFQDSTLVKVLNRGLYKEVPAQLRRWNKVNGKTVTGLVERRRVEIEHWRSEYDDEFVYDDDAEFWLDEELLQDEDPVGTANPEELSIAEQQSGGTEVEDSNPAPGEEDRDLPETLNT